MRYSLVAPHRRAGELALLPKSETPTLPQMKAATSNNTRELIAELAQLPEGREICSIICLNDCLRDPMLLKCRDAKYEGKALVSAEFHSTENGVTYLYVAKGYDPPNYTSPDGKSVSLARPGATSILRIDQEGNVTEIHRW